jgi:hypothetical protein
MKVTLQLLLTCVFFWGNITAFSQRGTPPKEKTSTRHVTKYPQHLDFVPSMVKLLKVPDGWDVTVAAAGLGRARMLYL